MTCLHRFGLCNLFTTGYVLSPYPDRCDGPIASYGPRSQPGTSGVSLGPHITA